MRMGDLLPDEQRKKLQSINKSKTPESEQLRPIKINEKLSTKEWRELMGMNRQTYTRRNGAVRRK